MPTPYIDRVCLSGLIAFKAERDCRCRSRREAPELCILGWMNRHEGSDPAFSTRGSDWPASLEKKKVRLGAHPITSTTPVAPSQINFRIQTNSLLFLLLSFLLTRPLSLNKSPFEAHKQRHCSRSVSPLPILALGESPRTSSSSTEPAETRRHRSTAADLCAQALFPCRRPCPSATSSPYGTFLILKTLSQGAPGPLLDEDMSPLPGRWGSSWVDGGEARRGGWFGRRRSLASVASGAEGLLSRLIGMRLLSESRVTQRGSFLMRGGVAVHPVDAWAMVF